MKKLNLNRKENLKSNFFGIDLFPEQNLYIKKRLDHLQDLSPSSARLELKLEKRKSCIKGVLKIQSFSENFTSTKASSDPIQTFLLLEEDIEEQLRDWKRSRFSNTLFNEFTKPFKSTENYV